MSMAERFAADNMAGEQPRHVKSMARNAMAVSMRLPDMIGGPIGAGCSVSHPNYKVGYYADNSILIWSANEGYMVLDEQRTYYRDTVEHLARCLGSFTKERRAEMIGGEDKWIDGIHWAADGSFLGF